MTDSMKQPIEQLNEKLKETFSSVVQLRTSVTIRGYKLDISRPADAELQDYLRFEYVGWMTHKWPQKKDIQEHEYTNLYKPNLIRGYNINIEAFKTMNTPPKFITADNGEYFVNKNLLTNDEEKGEILLRLLSQHDKNNDAFLTELQMVLHSKTPEVSKQIWADATSTNCPIYVKRPDVSNLDQSSEGLPVAYEEASWKKLLQKYVRVEQPKTLIRCNALSFPSEDDIDRKSQDLLDLDSFKKRYDNSVLKAFAAKHTGQTPRPFIILDNKIYMHANTITNEMEQKLFTMYLKNKQETFENITKTLFNTAYQCYKICSKDRSDDESPCHERDGRGQIPSNCKGYYANRSIGRTPLRPVDTSAKRQRQIAPPVVDPGFNPGTTRNKPALQRAKQAREKREASLQSTYTQVGNFESGERVLIYNLQRRNDLNNKIGMVVHKTDEDGLLRVLVATHSQEQIKVKPENLKKIKFTDAEEKYLSTFIDAFLRGDANISFQNQLVYIHPRLGLAEKGKGGLGDSKLDRRIGTIISVGETKVPKPPDRDWKNPLPNVQVRLGPTKTETVAVGLGQVSIIGLKPVEGFWNPFPAGGEVAPVVVGWPRPTPEEKSTQGPTKFGLITRFEPSTPIDRETTIGKAAIRWETQIRDFEETETLVPIEQLIVSKARNNLCEIKCYKSPTPVGEDGNCKRWRQDSFNEVETTTCQEYERNERKPNPFKLRI